MKRLLGHPMVILAALALVSLGMSYAAHGFAPQATVDSDGYLNFDWSSPRAVLTSTRTFGYPLFLLAVRSISTDPRAVPIAHWLAGVLAAGIFYQGLVLAGYRKGTALWATSTLLFTRAMLKFAPWVLADSLASSLSIAAAGFFLGTLAPQGRWSMWIGLTLTTFLAYQTRPAYLFLVPLWPVVALWLDGWLLRRSQQRQTVRRALWYVSASILPFLLFGLLRFVVIGHFGIVSFEGYNLIGVVGQFLDEQTAKELPDELRPLAELMLERRQQRSDAEPPSDFYAMQRMYNVTAWELAVPAAERLHGKSPVVINQALGRLSRELLVRHWRSYLRWLWWNAKHGIVQIVTLTFTDRGTVLLAAVFLGLHLWALWRGPPLAHGELADHVANQLRLDDVTRHREAQVLFWTALAFCIAKLLLVVLVEPANDRYMSGAMPLLPAAIGAFFAHYIERLGQPRV